jgi:hypothetical protein
MLAITLLRAPDPCFRHDPRFRPAVPQSMFAAQPPMNDNNPYRPPTPHEATSRPRKSPESLLQAAWQGARLGLKWMTLILGPFAALSFVLLVGAITWRQEWSERLADEFLRSRTLTALCGPFLVYLQCCVIGAAAGVMIGSLSYLLRRVRRKPGPQEVTPPAV